MTATPPRKSSFAFTPRTDLVTRVIDGRPRYFDKNGTEYDLFHRPLLGKSPEVQAQIKRMSDEAKLKSKLARNQAPAQVKSNRSEIEKKRTRVRALSDRIFDCGKVKDFYVNVKDEEVLTSWLEYVDKQMRFLSLYRNRLLDALVNADPKIDRCDAHIASAKDEIKVLEADIRRLENELKPKPADSETTTTVMTEERLLKKVPAAVVSQWLAAGLTMDQVLAMFNK